MVGIIQNCGLSHCVRERERVSARRRECANLPNCFHSWEYYCQHINHWFIITMLFNNFSIMYKLSKFVSQQLSSNYFKKIHNLMTSLTYKTKPWFRYNKNYTKLNVLFTLCSWVYASKASTIITVILPDINYDFLFPKELDIHICQRQR
jgi:hypothetical protein